MKLVAFAIALVAFGAFAGPYEIGEDLQQQSFWTTDPVLFVQRHKDSGFEFTSDQRDGADSRLDGGVECFGFPVYESRISFGSRGGIERVELMLYARGGTETTQVFTGADGKKFRRRERIDRTMSNEEFDFVLDAIRRRLTATKAKPPQINNESSRSARQGSQTWPKTEIPTQSTLTWNYAKTGKSSFRPGFIRLAVDGPARLAAYPSRRGVKKPAVAKGAKKIIDNVIDESKGRGDVFVDNVPMVDQGQKGYCAAAVTERVLRYYGSTIDEHEIAQQAGTSATGGTRTSDMKQAVTAIGEKNGLGFQDIVSMQAGIGDVEEQVSRYNKAAKAAKRPELSLAQFTRGDQIYVSELFEAMEPKVVYKMRQKDPRFKKFSAGVRQQVNAGIPVFWGVTLGMFPERGVNPQTSGGHMRLIIGYNDKKKEILYSDTWGEGHELKRMPEDWAFAITHDAFFLKPR